MVALSLAIVLKQWFVWCKKQYEPYFIKLNNRGPYRLAWNFTKGHAEWKKNECFPNSIFKWQVIEKGRWIMDYNFQNSWQCEIFLWGQTYFPASLSYAVDKDMFFDSISKSKVFKIVFPHDLWQNRLDCYLCKQRVIVLFPRCPPSPYWIYTQHPTCQWSRTSIYMSWHGVTSYYGPYQQSMKQMP